MDTSFSEKDRPTNSVCTKPTNTTKKPKTAKQMEAFKRANDMKNERLRSWREENIRRVERGEEPLIWATKAKARKDALKDKEKEAILHSLFLKSLEVQKKQLVEAEERTRLEKLKGSCKNTSNSTRKQKVVKPITKETYCYSESDSESEDEYVEPIPRSIRSEPLKPVKDDTIDTERVEQELETIEANVNDIRAEIERGEREAQFVKYLLQQQKELQKQQQQQPANKDPQTQQQSPATARPPQPAPPQPAPPQLPKRQEAYRTEPLDRSEIAKKPQYATREDFDDLKNEIVNKIQQQQQQQSPQIKMSGGSYNLITDTKIAKKPIEPPKYTTDLNYVYNQQTLQKPIEQQKPLNSVRSAINPPTNKDPIADPTPTELPTPGLNRPSLSEEQLRSMMGMRQRYEPVQPPKDAIQYTTNSALLNRMFFNR